jgi:hypothetical protein
MLARLRTTALDLARSGGPVLGVLLAGAWARWFLQRSMDLRDMPGAAGVLTVARAASGEFHRSWAAWLIGLVLPAAGGDVGAAAHLVALLCSVAMILGAMLGGWALADRAGAIGAGLVASAWSLAMVPTLVVGADPPAIGLAWLGVGLAWAGARAGTRGAPLLAGGTALVVLAAAVKELALPALPMLAATTVLTRGRWGKLLWMLPLQAGAGWWAWGVLSPRRVHEAASVPAVRLETLLGGLERVLALEENGWTAGLFPLMLGLAAAGALLPGRRQGRRLLVGLGAIAVVLATAAALDRRVRPRLLLSSCYALVVLVGVGAAVLSSWLSRFRLRHVPLLVLPLGLGLDAWAWAWDHASLRTRFAEAAPTGLPAPPAALSTRYAQGGARNWSGMRDLTLAGAVSLHGWVGAHAGGSVVTLRLRDERHRHLDAAAGLSGASAFLLDRGRCCAGLSEERCAAQLVAAFDEAGVALALPLQTKAVRRVNRQDDPWLEALRTAAEARGTLAPLGTWWEVAEPRGAGGRVACLKQSHAPTEQIAGWPPPLPTPSGGPDARRRGQPGGKGGKQGGKGGKHGGGEQGGPRGGGPPGQGGGGQPGRGAGPR